MRGAYTRASIFTFSTFFRGRFSTPKITPNLIPKSSNINYFCLLFRSWAAPGASQSDFGRSQIALGGLKWSSEVPGALWKLSRSLPGPPKNRFWSLRERFWTPQGAILELPGTILEQFCSKNRYFSWYQSSNDQSQTRNTLTTWESISIHQFLCK